MSGRYWQAVMAMLVLAVLGGAAGCLLTGTVDIPASDVWASITGGEVSKHSWSVIVRESRLPMVITSAMAGSALAVAGLLLQTCFNNPLAGPSILGISTGASLGVAVVVLAFGGVVAEQWGSYVNTIAGALVGAAGVLGILLLMSKVVKNTAMLLIVGILVGYFASSAIALLNFFSSQQSVHAYTVWGLGSFSGGSFDRSLIMMAITLPVVLFSMLLVKPLNAMLLGERYAGSLGTDVTKVRYLLLLGSGLLTAFATAFCGPIGFLGLIVPHISRMLLRTSNHAVLLPATALCGAALALWCSFVAVIFGGSSVIPINAITPVIGVPIVVYVILNRRKLKYFD